MKIQRIQILISWVDMPPFEPLRWDASVPGYSYVLTVVEKPQPSIHVETLLAEIFFWSLSWVKVQTVLNKAFYLFEGSD